MFRFKQFAVRQDRCPMKVGTDGVLLGAWAEVRPGDRRMLDVGTGTGLIALMLAQRSAAWITAVDIDVECATQAAENFAASPWADRLDAVSVAVQRYDPVEKFDLIVSNPPYVAAEDAHLLRDGLPFEPRCALTDGVDGGVGFGLKNLGDCGHGNLPRENGNRKGHREISAHKPRGRNPRKPHMRRFLSLLLRGERNRCFCAVA